VGDSHGHRGPGLDFVDFTQFDKCKSSRKDDKDYVRQYDYVLKIIWWMAGNKSLGTMFSTLEKDVFTDGTSGKLMKETGLTKSNKQKLP